MAQLPTELRSTAIQNAYTDTPLPHSNFLLGGLHYLFWLFFHPSAWQGYIQRVSNDTHRSEFTFIDLVGDRQHGQQRWRIILQLACWCILLPFLSVTILLLSKGFSGTTTLSTSLFLAVAALTYMTIAGCSVNVAVACVGGLVSTMAYGWGGTLVARGDLSGALALSLMGSVALTIAEQRGRHSSLRQTMGVLIGLGLGLLAVASIRLAGARVELTNLVSDMLNSWGWGSIYGGLRVGGAFSLSFVLPYLITLFLAGPRFGVVVGTFVCAIWQLFFARLAPQHVPQISVSLCVLSVTLGLTFHLWRPIILYPFIAIYNRLLFRLELNRANGHPALLRFHSAFWDEHQRLPLHGLDAHLLLVLERNPDEGRQALEYLAHNHYQRWAAQSTQIELDARLLERCEDIQRLGLVHRNLAAGDLAGPVTALLRSFNRVSLDIAAALHQKTSYNQRLALSAVEDRLDGLLRELARSSEHYALRFYPIADSWRYIVTTYMHMLADEIEARQEIDSPYIIGIPLTVQQEIFVGRTDISARIEQLLVDRRRPPLLLYGQRRMGKTSLLNNLGRLLPSTIVPFFVDLQGPVSRSNNHAGMLYHIARSMVESARQHRNIELTLVDRKVLEQDPFGAFDEWLSEVEYAFGESTGLLMLDEFEALDHAIANGRYDEETVLGTLRHIIQHRPRFKILLAGSHTLDEFRRWSSYLINVQVIHISYLHESETLQLIERPVEDFAMRYESEASQRILVLTRGHPFLVQLLCAEVVAYKNRQDTRLRRLACLEDVEAALPEALTSGDMFFADIAGNQVDGHSLALLRFIAAQGEGAIVYRESLDQIEQQESILRQLLQRDLLEMCNGGYRFQVELIRRWFALCS